MDGVVATLLGIAMAAALGGTLYRKFRSQSLPPLSDEEFVRMFCSRYQSSVPSDAILAERRRVAGAIGIPPERLAPEQTLENLSKLLSYLTDFSVAWNDLAEEAAEARKSRGLAPRQRPPMTIGELIEDRLLTSR